MIEISVDTRRAVVTNKEILTSGSAGIQVQFTLSEDWTGLSKLAVFRTGDDGESIDVVLDNNLNCVVPAEALETADEVLFIGVYGSDGNGTVIIPTIWAAAGVIRPGTEPNTPAEAEPTPEIWAQILSVAQEAETTATGAMNYVEQAVSDLGTLEDRVSDNEEDRVAAEQARVSADDTRAEAETARITNEDSRINAESNRNTAEVARSMAETARADAEAARVTAEQGRVSAESERAAAEAVREEKYAEYVETVSGYADDAEASAEAARTSMVNAQSASASASQSATRANNSATIAASKANEASSWADTALNAAGNAADSQSAAAQSATAAAASQTAAETAQTAAEAAQSAAEDAQDAAETAQAAAETAASSIAGKSEQIDQNTSDIGDLSRQISDLEGVVTDPTTGLDTKAPVILETASGAIASFSDGANGMPIKKLVANIEPVQAGTGDPSPDNVRPISGHTGAEIQQRGKNLLKNSENSVTKQGLTYTVNDDGTVTVSGTATASSYLSINVNKSFANAVIVNGSPTPLTSGVYIQVYTENGNYNDDGTGVNIEANNKILVIRCRIGNGITVNNVVFEPMIRLATETDSTFEPYTGNQISVTFPDEAGTVYGGTLTLNPDRTGTLVVDKAMVDLGTLTWRETNWNNIPSFISNNLRTVAIWIGGVNQIPNLDCSIYTKYTRTYLYNNDVIGICFANNGQNPDVIIRDSRYVGDLTGFVDEISGEQLVYDLKEPITYQLTESEISGILETLYGTNNVWADTGDVEVEYPADTKLYIEQLTKPTEDDMTADHAISAGTFFMIGNTLYLATSQIAAGGTITPGTNATQLSLADALNQLNA